VYDVDVALRRFKPLIKYMAFKYHRRGHMSLSFEDLEAEGLLTLVKCCSSFPEGQQRFARYFKRSLYNRLDNVLRREYQLKRQGIVVELSEVMARACPEAPHEDLSQRAKSIVPLLSGDAARLLDLITESSPELVEYAWRDFCRRNKLKKQGQKVSGWRRFRVQPRHIRGVLGMSARETRVAIRQIREVVKQKHFNS
jgi:hypothetical protein